MYLLKCISRIRRKIVQIGYLCKKSVYTQLESHSGPPLFVLRVCIKIYYRFILCHVLRIDIAPFHIGVFIHFNIYMVMRVCESANSGFSIATVWLQNNQLFRDCFRLYYYYYVEYTFFHAINRMHFSYFFYSLYFYFFRFVHIVSLCASKFIFPFGCAHERKIIFTYIILHPMYSSVCWRARLSCICLLYFWLNGQNFGEQNWVSSFEASIEKLFLLLHRSNSFLLMQIFNFNSQTTVDIIRWGGARSWTIAIEREWTGCI